MEEEAISAFRSGGRVVVEALPGAGKTRLLRKASEGIESSCLFVAYNNKLASETQRESPYLPCTTFHSLASRFFGVPVCDDNQLEQVLKQTPIEYPSFPGGVLIDEAQDVRGIYALVLVRLGLTCGPMLVVGDRNQLVYDFDPNFPASLDALDDPEKVFGVSNIPWQRFELNVTHRLTRPMVTFVNAVFGTKLKAIRDGPPVEVRVPRSLFELDSLLKDIVPPFLILVDRKKNNRSLRIYLNSLSRKGFSLQVHGVDDDTSIVDISCGTYWSSKGLGYHTVVAIVPSKVSRNPLYVALTRASEKLVIVLDPKEPNAALCRASIDMENAVAISGPNYRSIFRQYDATDEAEALVPKKYKAPSEFSLKNVENFTPMRWRRFLDARVAGATAVQAPLHLHACTLALCLAISEKRATGFVRAMECVLQPTMTDDCDSLIRAGFASRTVPSFVHPSSLLALDMLELARVAYYRWANKEDAAIVALAISAWDSYDHSMRSMLPVTNWIDTEAVLHALDVADKHMPTQAEYDVNLLKEGRYLRVHATDALRCYLLCTEISTSTLTRAVCSAGLHTNSQCRIINLFSGEVVDVNASYADLFVISDDNTSSCV